MFGQVIVNVHNGTRPYRYSGLIGSCTAMFTARRGGRGVGLAWYGEWLYARR